MFCILRIVILVVVAAGFLRKGRNYMRLFYWGRRVRGVGLHRCFWDGRGSNGWGWGCVGPTGRKDMILVGRGQGGRGRR